MAARAHFLKEAWQLQLGGTHASANLGVALDDQHGPALLGAGDRGGQTVRSRADNHDVRRAHDAAQGWRDRNSWTSSWPFSRSPALASWIRYSSVDFPR